ncbi:MAG: sporulation peptidase YabG [Bacillota bacterium]
MKIGDIVTRRIYGEDVQFCILGFYTKQSTGERVAILAMLDPCLIMEASVEELAPVSLRHLFALTTNVYTH